MNWYYFMVPFTIISLLFGEITPRNQNFKYPKKYIFYVEGEHHLDFILNTFLLPHFPHGDER